MGWRNCQCPGVVINYGRGQSDTCISVLSVSSSESRSARGRGSPARTHPHSPGARGTDRHSTSLGRLGGNAQEVVAWKKKKAPFFSSPGGLLKSSCARGRPERKRQDVCTPSPVSFAPTNAFEASRGITSRR